jgi:hypothetical protein
MHGLLRLWLRTNQMCSTANCVHDIDNCVSPFVHCHRAHMEFFSLEGVAMFALVNLLIAPVFLVLAVYGAKRRLYAIDKCCESDLPVMVGSCFAFSMLTLTLIFLIIGMMWLRVLLKRIVDITSFTHKLLIV